MAAAHLFRHADGDAAAALLPTLVARLPPAPILDDGRTWIGGVIRLLALILPAFAGKWVEAYANNPFYFGALAIIIVLFLSLGTTLERRLRDEARSMWKGGDR